MLTIGIPTYNREKAICANVEKLIKNELPHDVNVIILDNDSQDGTVEKIQKIIKNNKKFSLIKNNSNIGFGGSFFKLFELCQSNYLMITSDEDRILVERLNEFLQFLEENNPKIVVPQVWLNKRLYRGEIFSGDIPSNRIRHSTNYVSGLTFDVNSAKEIIPFLKRHFDSNEYVQAYPQVMLSVMMSAKGKSLFFKRALTRKEFQMKNEIESNILNMPFYSVTSRWEQIKSFSDILGVIMQKDFYNKEYYAKVKEEFLKQSTKIMQKAMVKERPDLANYFQVETCPGIISRFFCLIKNNLKR